jgi:hypothetical protein
LGDEGGSAWLAGAMKQLGQPDKGETMAKLRRRDSASRKPATRCSLLSVT